MAKEKKQPALKTDGLVKELKGGKIFVDGTHTKEPPQNLFSLKRIDYLIELRQQIQFLLWNRSVTLDANNYLSFRIYSAGKMWLSFRASDLVLLVMYDDRALYAMRNRTIAEESRAN